MRERMRNAGQYALLHLRVSWSKIFVVNIYLSSFIFFTDHYYFGTKFTGRQEVKFLKNSKTGLLRSKTLTVSFCQGIENSIVMATNSTSGSGVLDDILLSTKCDHTPITSETGDLTIDAVALLDDEAEPSTARAKQGEKRRRESSPHGVRGSDATTDLAPKHVSSTDFQFCKSENRSINDYDEWHSTSGKDLK